jgi:serine protease Do
MKHFLRPYRKFYLDRRRIAFDALAAALAAGACFAVAPMAAHAQAGTFVQLFEDSVPLLNHSSSQGYLGVYITDVDADKAQSLKLKEVRGAVITLIDHDAPAGQIGLKINDVVLALNGENVQDAEQLRKLLREIPPGRKVSLEISRDGNIQTLAVQLADRKALDHDVMNKIDAGVDDPGSAPSTGFFAGGGGGDVPSSSGFHLPFLGSTLNVGALVEPLTTQTADYLGVSGGVMVKRITRRSEAATAGLHVFDVILRVGPDIIDTPAAWDRALRSNEGKPVQVTILRDRKQQTLTLQVDSKHHQSKVQHENTLAAPEDKPAA